MMVEILRKVEWENIVLRYMTGFATKVWCHQWFRRSTNLTLKIRYDVVCCSNTQLCDNTVN